MNCTRIEKPPVLVLGMHRSGTSLLAHIVHESGVSVGDAGCLSPPSRTNEDGYWENRNLVAFNDQLLGLVEASWIVPPASPESVAALAEDAAMADEARRIVADIASHGHPWMAKDPRLCLLLSFWSRIVPEAMYVVAVRHPVSVASSLGKRDEFPSSAAVLLWQVYLQSILRDVPADARVLFVAYEDLLRDPLRSCTRLDAFLHQGGSDWDDRDARITKMAKVVRRPLCHFEGAGAARGLGAIDRSQAELLEAIQGLTAADTATKLPWLPQSSIYPGWHEYLSLWENGRSYVRPKKGDKKTA